MKTIIAGLKWLSQFLERRFPEPFHPSDFILRNEYTAAIGVYSEMIQQNAIDIAALKDENKKSKEQMEKISLLIGLSRPMQTILRQQGAHK